MVGPTQVVDFLHEVFSEPKTLKTRMHRQTLDITDVDLSGVYKHLARNDCGVSNNFAIDTADYANASARVSPISVAEIPLKPEYQQVEYLGVLFGSLGIIQDFESEFAVRSHSAHRKELKVLALLATFAWVLVSSIQVKISWWHRQTRLNLQPAPQRPHRKRQHLMRGLHRRRHQRKPPR